MEFIINGAVKYNSADGTLLLTDHSVDMLTLTRITNELLLLFINNNNVSLSRDEILNQLWENKGLSSSSNNLNNYISMLRKALEQCGCEGLITTIPKYGFIFEADVILVAEKCKNNNHAHNKIIEKVPITPIPIIEQRGGEPDPGYTSFRKKVAGVVLATLITMIFFSPEIYSYLKLQVDRHEILNIKNCSIYTTDNKIVSNNSKESLGVIKSTIISLALNCDHKANIYYFSESQTNSLGHEFFIRTLSYCPYKIKGPCENYYF